MMNPMMGGMGMGMHPGMIGGMHHMMNPMMAGMGMHPGMMGILNYAIFVLLFNNMYECIFFL